MHSSLWFCNLDWGNLTSIKSKLFAYRRNFYDKRMAQEVGAECLGDEWKVSVYQLQWKA
jgi:hypothetical protein